MAPGYLNTLMKSFACVVLPSLHCQSPDKRKLHLWPGHDDGAPAGYWSPGAYLLTPAEARACLNWFRAADALELERMRALALGSSLAATMGEMDELATLRDFAGAPASARLPELLARHAQKVLLWRWWQEELELQILQLEKACEIASRDLLACVREPEETPVQDVATSARELPWRSCVASALPFLPLEMPLLARGQMARDLADRFHFATGVAEIMPACPAAWLSAEQVVGRAQAWPEQSWRKPRLWLLEQPHA